MYQIIKKEKLSPQITRMEVKAPFVAKKVQAGQFIILRVSEHGERIPLTVADYNREAGTVVIIFQEIGKTTRELGALSAGAYILDFVGPLGVATHLDGIQKAAVIGGGLGTAIAYPSAKALYEKGAQVDLIAGFRNKDLIILEEELHRVANRVFLTTDDGSNGRQGFVTDVLKSLIAEGNEYDLVIAIGPLLMMKFVAKLTKEYGIKTIVSMNPVMIDGTGMCGGCRVSVGGETKFACVDGPDFDGHLVDFDLAIRRQSMYREQEKEACESCRIRGTEHA